MALSHVDIKYFKEAVGFSRVGRETDVDISARCPVCGDSARKSNSKRLHLYQKGDVTNVSCFNGDCSCTNKTVYSFLRDFFPDLLPGYKRETFGNTMEKLKESKGLKDLIKPLDTWDDPEDDPVKCLDLSGYMLDLNCSDEGVMYLRNRGIEYRPNRNMGKWYFGTQDLKIGETQYNITNSIVIPLYYKQQMYGFYSRSIKDKNFITYMDDSNIGFKIWNFFNVDLSSPVYIFEGIFDAISSGKTNIIALLGAKLPEDRLKEIKYPVFVLDNDRTGILNMIEYAGKGFNCFVQPKNIPEKDMNEMMLNHPKLDIPGLIDDNTFKGLSAVSRLKLKL